MKKQIAIASAITANFALRATVSPQNIVGKKHQHQAQHTRWTRPRRRFWSCQNQRYCRHMGRRKN